MNSPRSRIKSTFSRFSSERAETLPATIITGIVSALILLGVAGALATVITEQKDAEVIADASTTATNIEVSLRSDATTATKITALSSTSVRFHIPGKAVDQCKMVTWNVSNDTVTRELNIYNKTKEVNKAIECDTNSTLSASNVRTLSANLLPNSVFKYTNALGRVLVNDTAGNVVPQDPAAAAPSSEFAVETAWASNKVAKVSYNFTIKASTGNITRDVEQAASTPLYTTPQDKQNTELGNSTGFRPAVTTVIINKNPIVVGQPYILGWQAASCGPDMTTTYTVYAGPTPTTMVPTGTTPNLSTAPRTVNTADDSSISHGIVVNCTRGSLVISGEMSNILTTPIVPPAPTVRLAQQPTASNAALNSALVPEITGCVPGTTPKYNITRTEATSGGGVGRVTGPLTDTNKTINSEGFVVNEGAQYNYSVNAWCLTSKNVASGTNGSINPSGETVPNAANTVGAVDQNPTVATGSFVTLINRPATPVFTYPANGETGVTKFLLIQLDEAKTDKRIKWTPVECAPGTTTRYEVNKVRDKGVTMATPTRVIPDNYEDGSPMTDIAAIDERVKAGTNVGYRVKAYCEGTAIVDSSKIRSIWSGETGFSFTTGVGYPSPSRLYEPGDNPNRTAAQRTADIKNNTLTWDNPPAGGECEPDTSIVYQLAQSKANGLEVKVFGDWTTNRESAPPISNLKQGTPTWVYLTSYCQGVNALSGTSAKSNNARWMTPMDNPSDVGKSTLNIKTQRKVVGSFECGYGTTVQDAHIYLASDKFAPSPANSVVGTAWSSLTTQIGDAGYATSPTYNPRTDAVYNGGNTGWIDWNGEDSFRPEIVTDPAGGYRYWVNTANNPTLDSTPKAGYGYRPTASNTKTDFSYFNMASNPGPTGTNMSGWSYVTCGNEFTSQTFKTDIGTTLGASPATKGIGTPTTRMNALNTSLRATAQGLDVLDDDETRSPQN